MNLKQNIIALINASGIENKEVVKILDEIRKGYHSPQNTGTKMLDSKEHSKMRAKFRNKYLTLSKDKNFVFYQGDWRKVYQDEEGKHFVYLKSKNHFKIKK